ncbi:signal recognition particle protein [Lentilactobacillus hilgardii]|uniref:Signal recognition particle protein n=1 Tax=Lentilactobacillus hilgardii (strain ATCC 8290 / DSM 20176 / CCUG 30140 / JCM 1155 / KCTC 3500 / NBRC 15886 / NCIMB 8040 / NRRL B-1843 / 9) TaxID=1423757 RepID=C0XM48_LENH9|nr:signal recognition particle protein [Lentilactobacillus hilgardii]EEI18642.1 signal recognition particle protein [Lentilactobacillus buchneri ATCC 11577]EEI23587.1 signal recognition particle protein [Lentilactobacillus hilgardii DSM 20176 = ATCC 8290]KRK56986.1 signal recognition particle protein Ffh [Lentilactobacillus hilgardii DSM 20176 = ATCC 8290]MCP9332061.1 signal recognition particle protein [Lentilactobacillus hilgardii]MCP9348628.1 signal recognition particle protein [Lentilactob
MAFEGLTERLQNAMKKLRGKGKVSEADLRATMREIRLALLEADVNFQVVRTFVKTVEERAKGAKVLEGLNPSQQIVKIVDEELTKTMGQEAVPLNKSEKIPTVIMMSGLQGAGKTTTVGKLALKLKNEQNARPLLIADDVYRPAAIEQLQTVGQQVDVPVFQLGTDVDPVEIAKRGLEKAKEDHNDYVIIDTAGRLQIDEKLMDELGNIKKAVNPDEILLVIDAMTGQNAVATAEGFDKTLDVTGVVLTKLDGDTRGGAALSIRAVTGKPIKFVGQGEKMEDLDVFHPDRMASRILGMGDMLSLIEKTQKEYDQKQAEELSEKIKENTFDFNDFLDQLDQIQKMGPLDEIMKMIPGMANNPALQNVNMNPKDMDHLKAIIYSMTEQERTDPDVMNPSRRRRISRGSGRPIQEVNRMIKQFGQMKTMMNKVSKGNMSGMENMMGQTGMGGKLSKLAMKQFGRKMKKNKKKRLKKKRKKH